MLGACDGLDSCSLSVRAAMLPEPFLERLTSSFMVTAVTCCTNISCVSDTTHAMTHAHTMWLDTSLSVAQCNMMR